MEESKRRASGCCTLFLGKKLYGADSLLRVLRGVHKEWSSFSFFAHHISHAYKCISPCSNLNRRGAKSYSNTFASFSGNITLYSVSGQQKPSDLLTMTTTFVVLFILLSYTRFTRSHVCMTERPDEKPEEDSASSPLPPTSRPPFSDAPNACELHNFF